MSLLRFFWWNVENFAHYDPARAGRDRWPASEAEYHAKRDRIEEVLRRVSGNDRPHLLAFAETTDAAARGLRDRLFPTYQLHELGSLDPNGLNVAVLYDPASGFGDEYFFAPTTLPNTSRPIAWVDHRSPGHRIRFFCCHWPARISPESGKWRSLIAHQLALELYSFLRPAEPVPAISHAIILGDLNEEPCGLLDEWLHTSRSRTRARTPEHPTDVPIRRVRLYNCGWKLLGERYPHPLGTGERAIAGTYYWRDRREWRTFDQVIVTGSLLGSETPHLDERSVEVVCGPELIPENSSTGTGLRGLSSGTADTPAGCPTTSRSAEWSSYKGQS